MSSLQALNSNIPLPVKVSIQSCAFFNKKQSDVYRGFCVSCSRQNPTFLQLLSSQKPPLCCSTVLSMTLSFALLLDRANCPARSCGLFSSVLAGLICVPSSAPLCSMNSDLPLSSSAWDPLDPPGCLNSSSSINYIFMLYFLKVLHTHRFTRLMQQNRNCILNFSWLTNCLCPSDPVNKIWIFCQISILWIKLS